MRPQDRGVRVIVGDSHPATALQMLLLSLVSVTGRVSTFADLLDSSPFPAGSAAARCSILITAPAPTSSPTSVPVGTLSLFSIERAGVFLDLAFFPAGLVSLSPKLVPFFAASSLRFSNCSCSLVQAGHRFFARRASSSIDFASRDITYQIKRSEVTRGCSLILRRVGIVYLTVSSAGHALFSY